MFHLNRIELIGNLGNDPELRYTQDGQPVASLSLATNERWKNRSGQPQERVEWHRITVWGDLAEIVKKYLAKGSYIRVIGRLQSRSYEKDGVKKTVWEVIAHEVNFLDRRPESAGDTSEPAGAGAADAGPPPGEPPPF